MRKRPELTINPAKKGRRITHQAELLVKAREDDARRIWTVVLQQELERLERHTAKRRLG